MIRFESFFELAIRATPATMAMKAKAPVQSLPQFDEEILKDAKLPTLSQRPVSSVVTDVTQ